MEVIYTVAKSTKRHEVDTGSMWRSRSVSIPIPLGQLQVDPEYLATVSGAGPLQRDNRNWKENAATMSTRVPYNRVWYPFVTP